MSGSTLIRVLTGSAAADWVGKRSSAAPNAELERQVKEIVEEVRVRGDSAVQEYTEVLDGVRLDDLRVTVERCTAALEALPTAIRGALEQARINLARVHAAQHQSESEVLVVPGVTTWREFRPIRRIGIYAPGGLATYPSSVLMAAVPARLAGCEQIAVCSPPTPSGEPSEAIMAASALAGVNELYAVGGAQAIAAMAFGTETIAPVDKIFGPGGRWVNAAKLSVFSEVEIDLAAGPSEVVVWTDDFSRPDWVAGELLAQAEHGEDSICVGVLRSDEQAAKVCGHLSSQLATLGRQQIIRQSLSRSALLVARNDYEALGWVNRLASEHLVLLRSDARELVPRIQNAGSVFLGEYTPVAAGDYATGTNHILPTGGRARGADGLALHDFGRWIQFQEIEPEGLRQLAPTIEALAEWEGLTAHAASVRVRAEST